MKKILAITAAAMLSGNAGAAILIPTLHTPVTENFTGWGGTAMPDNWTMTGVSDPLYRGQGTGSGISGGVWSYGVDASDRALGYLGNADTAQSIAFTATFRNTTGGAIP